MTAPAQTAVAPADGAIPQRERSEAWDRIIAALQPISAEFQASLQLRRVDNTINQHHAVGWEAYINEPPPAGAGAVWVAFLADTTKDDPPIAQVNQRFMGTA